MTEEILKAADTHVEPARPLRVIHVEDFESAAPLSDAERDACRRRFPPCLQTRHVRAAEVWAV